MTITLGTTQINKMYLDNTEILKCYLGETLVYEEVPEPKTYTIQQMSYGELIIETSSTLPYTVKSNGVDICTIQEDDGTYLLVDWYVDGMNLPTYISVGQATAHQGLEGYDWTVTWVNDNTISINRTPVSE